VGINEAITLFVLTFGHKSGLLKGNTPQRANGDYQFYQTFGDLVQKPLPTSDSLMSNGSGAAKSGLGVRRGAFQVN